MNDILMQVRDLSYRYEDQTLALDKVNLDIRRHERLAIMGSNGSGKSTLFLNLNGVYKPTSGQILYEGKPLDYSRKGLLQLRRNVGIVFQDPDNQLFCASVAGEISFGLYNLGLEEEEIRTRVDQVCDRLSITPFRTKPTHFLSGGQKKRVSIADILVNGTAAAHLGRTVQRTGPKARTDDRRYSGAAGTGGHHRRHCHPQHRPRLPLGGPRCPAQQCAYSCTRLSRADFLRP